MRIVFLIFVLFVVRCWSHDVDFSGYHSKVGVKEARRIAELEALKPIVGGAVAPVNAHPYLAGLIIDLLGLSATSACGGSLISANRVLTAAHCWHDGRLQAWRFTVVLGSPFLYHGGVRLIASAIVVHPHYNVYTLANDVAILHLPAQVPYSSAIRPITLPLPPFLNVEYTGHWGIASGYGKYSDLTNPTVNTIVRHVLLQVITMEQCRDIYGHYVLDSNVCTSGVGGIGICQGDSGGPLTMIMNGQEVLIGVSSFVALDGCELGYPSAFARVTHFLGWILTNL